jgi:hypothetical protein
MAAGAYVEPFLVFGGGDHDGGGGFRVSWRQPLFATETIRSSATVGLFFALLKP